MALSTASHDMVRFVNALYNGRLSDVIELTNIFANDFERLSEALIESCKYNHLDTVKWLVEHTEVHINSRQSYYYTPLVAASWYGCLDIVKYLIETCHADVNLPDGDYITPLVAACRRVSMSVSMYLLNDVGDVDVNAVDGNGNTALHYAVWFNKHHKGYTQLHMACVESGDKNVVKRLVYASDQEVNIQDNEGNTPLHRACEYGHSDIVETLMFAGANETITNDLGQSPAQVAEWTKHNELLKLLDRDSLWEVMQRRSKLSVGCLMMLTLLLVQRKVIRRKWRCAQFFIQVVAISSGIFSSQKNKRRKLN